MDEVTKVHLALKQKLSNGMVIGSSEYENLCKQVEALLGKGLAQRKKTPFDKFDALETSGSLKAGSYDVLREIFLNSLNVGFVDDINAADDKIKDIRARRDTTAGPSEKGLGASSAPPSSPDSDDCYQITRGQKGLLVIINFKDNRAGTEKDVDNLKSFFETTLRFEVHDERKAKEHDFDTDELNTYLETIQRKLNADQYYCFILVTLSHGDKDGISTRDKRKIKIDDIRKMFNSENVPQFKGRPKLIFVQKCQGGGKQPGVPLEDNNDHSEDTSESDESQTAPVDADTLISFSNTPGYLSFRDANFGTQFIQQIVGVFKAEHKRSHVEEMLIKVRYNVAKITVQHKGVECKEMPCVWTTLRKKLMLK